MGIMYRVLNGKHKSPGEDQERDNEQRPNYAKNEYRSQYWRQQQQQQWTPEKQRQLEQRVYGRTPQEHAEIQARMRHYNDDKETINEKKR